MTSADVAAEDTTLRASEAIKTSFWSPPDKIKVDPTGIAAPLMRYMFVADRVTYTSTVIADPEVLATDKPMSVVTVAAATVVSVEGEVPTSFAVYEVKVLAMAVILFCGHYI
jgi:hypothetical protein